MSYEPDDAMETAGALLAMVLAALGLAVIAIVLLMTTRGASALECQDRPDGRTYWTYRVVDGDRCWYRGHRVLPKRSLHWPDPPKPIIVPDKVRAEAPAELVDTTWHMARPFDEAQPINPPLLVQDDPDVWPKLSEFEGRFIGRQQ